MRMIYEVINEIKNEIPEEFQEANPNFIEELDEISKAAAYKAPEQMRPYFVQTADTLNYYLGEPTTDWERRIVNIFADKTVFEDV